ncbi:MAG: hypothetical protein Q8880_11510 [Bacteroidota bacterium]|nr:hypothetical protein [Bacteroidota bacterium]
MRELEKSDNLYSISNNENMYTLVSNGTIRAESVFYDKKMQRLIIAVKHYNTSGTYDTDYIFLDQNMNIIDCLKENEGVMPSFITAPDESIWVRLTSTNTDKIRESILPLECRDRIVKENLMTEFVDHYSISGKDGNILFSKDIFNDKKPDKMCRLIFDKNNLLKSRKVSNLPLPSKVMPALSGELLQISNALRPDKILHREIDFDMNIVRSREINLGLEYDFVFSINLSFDNECTFFLTIGNGMYQVKVDKNGDAIETKSLVSVENCNDYFYNIWAPSLIDKEVYAVRFNYESGSGYAIVKNNEIFECWTNEDDTSIYKDLVTGAAIDLNSSNLKLCEIISISNEKYALFFGTFNSDVREKELKILIKDLG